MGKIAIATTTLSKHGKTVRPALALKTVKAARQMGIPIVVVYKGLRSPFIKKLEKHGTRAFPEKKPGMGHGRRQALAEAARIAGKEGVVVWMEPEKHPFVRFIPALAKPIMKGRADLVIPMRSSLSSYPKDQQQEEALLNLVYEKIVGKKKADFTFGPRLMDAKALSHFLRYKGEYGDEWDSIVIPILRAIKTGLAVRYENVPYVHPKEQTREETGSARMFEKRIVQFCNIAPALIEEAKKLGLPFYPLPPKL